MYCAGNCFVVKKVIINTIRQIFSGKTIAKIKQLSILHTSCIISFAKDDAPPTVRDDQLIREIRIEIPYDENVIDAITVGCNDIGDFKIGF